MAEAGDGTAPENPPPAGPAAELLAVYDEAVRSFFSPADLQLSPEEYTARHAHEWALFSFHLRAYRDPVLGAWVRRLGELLFDPAAVEAARLRFLTDAEREDVRERELEDF
jgi:hypothetical protein